jgi:hypothetical protein
MGANLSLNAEYKITIHPKVWLDTNTAARLKKTKKTKKNNQKEIKTFETTYLEGSEKAKHIERFIKTYKFKKIIQQATHITNMGDYVEKKLKFKPSKITYNNVENKLVVKGIWTVENGSKVAMELHNTPESRIADAVRDGLHKAGYAGEIIIGHLPIGAVYFGMPAREISLEKISS